jgi:hypothetical protein
MSLASAAERKDGTKVKIAALHCQVSTARTMPSKKNGTNGGRRQSRRLRIADGFAV